MAPEMIILLAAVLTVIVIVIVTSLTIFARLSQRASVKEVSEVIEQKTESAKEDIAQVVRDGT